MSRISIPLEDRLISEAEFGFFHAYEKITKKKAEELRKKGCVVTDSHESKSFPRLHKISWKMAGVGVFDYDSVSSLDEHNPNYSLAKKLWIISMKNQPPLHA